MRNRIVSLESLSEHLVLTREEKGALAMGAQGKLPMAITPYYLSLIDRHNPDDPIRKCVVPRVEEFLKDPAESGDPLAEQDHYAVPGLVHRYPDRVLFILTGLCASYCRYCTRSRLVGDQRHSYEQRWRKRWENCIEYIRNTPTVRDVILSGGDPLVLENNILEWVLKRLREIPHVEIIRIGSKVPAVLPQRVTPSLAQMLRKYNPLFLSLHFTHPAELTKETARACEILADAGLPMGSQTVVLQGVNDETQALGDLFRGLLKIRVKPYYLYQCDPIVGSSHFRAPVSKGLEIMRGLRGYTSGYAIPTFVVDAPGGGGKIPLLPDYVVKKGEEGLILKNYAGDIFVYPDTEVPGEVTL